MEDDRVVPFRPRRVRDRNVSVGGPVDSTTVGLRLYGDDLEPDEVTRLLGTAPTMARRRGERFAARPGIPPARMGQWFLEEDWAAEEPDVLARRLLDRLPTDPARWAALSSRFRVAICFGISLQAWNRGFTLSAATVGRLAVLGAEVGFDIYGAGEPPFDLDNPSA